MGISICIIRKNCRTFSCFISAVLYCNYLFTAKKDYKMLVKCIWIGAITGEVAEAVQQFVVMIERIVNAANTIMNGGSVSFQKGFFTSIILHILICLVVATVLFCIMKGYQTKNSKLFISGWVGLLAYHLYTILDWFVGIQSLVVRYGVQKLIVTLMVINIICIVIGCICKQKRMKQVGICLFTALYILEIILVFLWYGEGARFSWLRYDLSEYAATLSDWYYKDALILFGYWLYRKKFKTQAAETVEKQPAE